MTRETAVCAVCAAPWVKITYGSDERLNVSPIGSPRAACSVTVSRPTACSLVPTIGFPDSVRWALGGSRTSNAVGWCSGAGTGDWTNVWVRWRLLGSAPRAESGGGGSGWPCDVGAWWAPSHRKESLREPPSDIFNSAKSLVSAKLRGCARDERGES